MKPITFYSMVCRLPSVYSYCAQRRRAPGDSERRYERTHHRMQGQKYSSSHHPTVKVSYYLEELREAYGLQYDAKKIDIMSNIRPSF
jgi:hypothetical protein